MFLYVLHKWVLALPGPFFAPRNIVIHPLI